MFFEKKDYNDWLKLEDSQIEKIHLKLEGIQNLAGLEEDINNLQSFLTTLKKNRNAKIAEMLHKKAIEIDEKIKKLSEEFENIKKESDKIVKYEEQINHFYELSIYNFKFKKEYKVNVKEGEWFNIGTHKIGNEELSENIKNLLFKKYITTKYLFSRDHIELKINKNELETKYKGTNNGYISYGSKHIPVSKEKNAHNILPLNYEINMSVSLWDITQGKVEDEGIDSVVFKVTKIQ